MTTPVCKNIPLENLFSSKTPACSYKTSASLLRANCRKYIQLDKKIKLGD
ncbi:49_t:CDS:1, partial [Paraglomus occultum]